MVGVCNNLAFGKVDKDSDIDLFIVAKSGRLFLVRIFVTLLFQVMGIRRHGDKVAGRFCLSFFVDEDRLDLSRIAIENDIYLALWIRTMEPVIDRGVMPKLIKENLWVRRYLGDGEMVFGKIVGSGGRLINSRGFLNLLRGGFDWIYNGSFGNAVEGILRRWQMSRSRKKMEKADDRASLIVERHILKFHNVDRRAYYRDLWYKKYGSYENVDLDRFCLL